MGLSVLSAIPDRDIPLHLVLRAERGHGGIIRKHRDPAKPTSPGVQGPWLGIEESYCGKLLLVWIGEVTGHARWRGRCVIVYGAAVHEAIGRICLSIREAGSNQANLWVRGRQPKLGY